jgi:hypothetical protein
VELVAPTGDMRNAYTRNISAEKFQEENLIEYLSVVLFKYKVYCSFYPRFLFDNLFI